MFRRVAVTFISLVPVVLLAATAGAAGTYWTRPAGKSGDWSDASYWSNGVPSSAARAFVTNGGTVDITQAGASCDYLTLDNLSTVQMSSGTLFSNRPAIGGTGPATFNQTGGTFTMGAGYYLSVASHSSAPANYKLSGNGVISAWYEFVGMDGTGEFGQSGGANTVTGVLFVGYRSSGTYSLSSGYLNTCITEVGAGGDALSSGTFTQSGGTHSVSNYLYVGTDDNDSGTYILNGPGKMIAAVGEYVGEHGQGNFTQSSGTNSAGLWLYLGDKLDSNGTYALSGSGQLAAATEYLGNYGSGTFTQTGGSNSASNLIFASISGSSGVYDLNGGVLSTTAMSRGSGTSQFNFGGGTLKAGGRLSTSLPMTLTGVGGNANVDTAGFVVTFSGSLSGRGGLNKLGSNTLTLAAANTYTGDTTVGAGTLTLANSGSLLLDVNNATNSLITVASGAKLDLFGTIRVDTGDITISSGNWTLVSNAGTDVYEPSFSLAMLNSGSFTQVNDIWTYVSGSRQWTFTESTGVLSLVTVPEPSTLVLLSVAAIGLLGCAWRKQR
ncbi:MAG: autotransporter-associated beta strand repeat-containing protein [Thermoguttaceae bacterium]